MADISKKSASLDDDSPSDTEANVRRLTPEELVELRRDMAESSAWAKAELKRRRAERIKKI
ncbi:hypothetical protein VRK_07260 [Vibrio sp. MEBiC08052]|nr:hypothetical protein VRK_07260 [Vibrio sp. MEBiC08052]